MIYDEQAIHINKYNKKKNGEKDIMININMGTSR